MVERVCKAWKFRDADIEFVLSRVLRPEIKSQQLRPRIKFVGRMGGGFRV
jgi:hypothetical protein